jgi:flagellar assembly protein FliH
MEKLPWEQKAKMSTSFNPALKSGPKIEALPFLYPPAEEGPANQCASGSNAQTTENVQPVPSDDGEAIGREEVSRDAARQEGEAKARSAFEQHLEQVRESVRVALSDFARERKTYFELVETEVVKLALSIARKILHREAQVDPLLLAGIVRVAVDGIKSKTRVVVRVHPGQAADCRSYFAQHMEPSDAREVIEDSALEIDHCTLQTELGTTELGIEVQLKEIEHGLMDLLALRPQAKP